MHPAVRLLVPGRFAALASRHPGCCRLAAATLLVFSAAARCSLAQSAFDPSWYDPSASYVKISVVSDGVYRVTGGELQMIGVPISLIDPETLRLFEHGEEIPIDVSANGPTLETGDSFSFVGSRNSGEDETWAYNEIASNMSSTYNSLYTDTTHYWLSWGQTAGLRYAEIDPPANGAPVAQRTSAQLRIENDVHYFPGQGSSAGSPIYTTAEGYYQDQIRHNTSQSPIVREYNFALDDPSSAPSDSLTVTTLVSAETVSRHKIVVELTLDMGSGPVMTPVDSLEWVGAVTQTLHARVPQDLLPADGNLGVRLVSRNNYSSATPNNMLVDWVNVQYSRLIRTVDGQAVVRTQAGSHTYTASNVTGSLRVFRPATAEAFTRMPATGEAAFVLESATPDAIHLVEGGSYRSPVVIASDQPSNLVAPPLGGADYVILTTASLIASAQALADMRATATGGSHTTLVVDVQDVFDQFDYGRPTPVAIRRFVRAARQWANPMEFLTLWGDALYPDKSRPRQNWEVPSFGHTVSDGWFAMQNGGLGDYSVSVAVGRLPVRSNEQGAVVAQKLADYELAPLDLWQKNAIFLAGGFTVRERQRLRQAARKWSSLVSDEPATMDTVHFFKESPNVLDPTFKDSIQQALRVGSSWVVYFGHSATQTWEIVTDPPALFDNAATLPVVLSLGCFTGDFAIGVGDAADILSFSEQLVIESANGSIAHWGASSSGTIGASDRFSDEVHRSVFTDSLRVLGIAIKEAMERYNDLYTDPISVKHLLQYGLVGDPATSISLPSDVDFRALAQDIRISPFAPVPADDELIVDVTVRNIGLYPADTTTAVITHTRPDGSTVEFERRVAPFANELPLQIRVPIDASSIGQNRIRLTLDADDELPELDETNNVAEQQITVFSSGLAVVEPPDYALYPTSDVRLVVNTSSAGIENPSVIFQLDTLRTFDSSALVEHTAVASDLIAVWEPPALDDEQLYYWRVRVDASGQEDIWTSRSFTIRSSLGETGWYQAGMQLADAATSPELSAWNGGWSLKTFSLDASASSERGSGIEKGQFVVNGQFYERLELGFGILLIDGATATVKASAAGPTYANGFEDPALVVAELRAVANLAAPGDYVMTRTRHLANQNAETVIPDSIRAIFRDLGSVAIDNITYQDLWIMFTQVGSPEKLREFVSPASSGLEEITERFAPEFRFDRAEILSAAVGPVSTWERLVVDGEAAGGGNITVDVLDAAGELVLAAGIPVPGMAELDISEREHPFIRLRATIEDTTRFTTPQLERWRVTFVPVPELAIDPASLSLSADSVAVGTPLTASVGFRNLSQVAADTVVVRYEVVDSENSTTLVAVDTLLNVLAAAESTREFGTDEFVGENRLRISLEQPGLVEPISVNNVAILPFTVSGDESPPAFTVLVDGEALPHDPDPVVNLQDPALPFVSSRPLIDIIVEDDFGFSDFDVDSTVVEVSLDDEPVAADELDVVLSEDRRQLSIRFEPDLTERDSTHTLVVEVRDSRGNVALGSPHQVHFRVQSAMQLEATYPYPNPMHNHTRFAFRLRGADAEMIDEMVLRIYTVSGRLVRQFDLVDEPEWLDAGTLKIGWNKLLWDGRDSDGDRVATGVYLYRVFARSEDGVLDTGGVEKVAVIR